MDGGGGVGGSVLVGVGRGGRVLWGETLFGIGKGGWGSMPRSFIGGVATGGFVFVCCV